MPSQLWLLVASASPMDNPFHAPCMDHRIPLRIAVLGVDEPGHVHLDAPAYRSFGSTLKDPGFPANALAGVMTKSSPRPFGGCAGLSGVREHLCGEDLGITLHFVFFLFERSTTERVSAY